MFGDRLKALKAWWRKLQWIIDHYERDLHVLQDRSAAVEHLLRERTKVGVEMNYKGQSYVIVVGSYGGTDYVQTFGMHERQLQPIIDDLRRMTRHHDIQYVDAPPEFRAAVKQDLASSMQGERRVRR
jgi:hypothetical protein